LEQQINFSSRRGLIIDNAVSFRCLDNHILQFLKKNMQSLKDASPNNQNKEREKRGRARKQESKKRKKKEYPYILFLIIYVINKVNNHT